MIFPQNLKTTDNLVGKQYVRPNLKARIERGDGVVQSLANAHDAYRTLCEKIVEAVKKPDPSSTEDGHFLEMRELAYKRATAAAKKNDAAMERAKAEIAASKNALRSQLGLVEDSRAAEIRGYLRTLGQEERSQILNNAIDGGDAATIAAVIHAPAYLSGETAERGARFKERYEKQHGGDLAERTADLEQALSINKGAGEDSIAFLASLFPAAKYDAIVAKQAAAREMRASLDD